MAKGMFFSERAVKLKNKNSSNIFIKRCFLPISSIKIGDETATF